MLHDHLVESARVAERAAHDLSIGHGLQAVGEAERAELGQQSDLGDLPALQPAGHRAIRVDLGQLHLARAAGDELDAGHVVHDRVRVGQRRHRGDSSLGRGQAGARDGLLVLPARLAQLHAHVDQARRQAMTAAVDGRQSVRHAVGEQARPQVRDAAVLGEQGAW